jgi:hypothetical protein
MPSGSWTRWDSARPFHVIRDGPSSLWEGGRRPPKAPMAAALSSRCRRRLTGELKNVLPHRRLVYYGKLVKARPMLVALDVVSPRLRPRARLADRTRYAREYHAGTALGHGQAHHGVA